MLTMNMLWAAFIVYTAFVVITNWSEIIHVSLGYWILCCSSLSVLLGIVSMYICGSLPSKQQKWLNKKTSYLNGHANGHLPKSEDNCINFTVTPGVAENNGLLLDQISCTNESFKTLPQPITFSDIPSDCSTLSGDYPTASATDSSSRAAEPEHISGSLKTKAVTFATENADAELHEAAKQELKLELEIQQLMLKCLNWRQLRRLAFILYHGGFLTAKELLSLQLPTFTIWNSRCKVSSDSVKTMFEILKTKNHWQPMFCNALRNSEMRLDYAIRKRMLNLTVS